jgi:hypothetical protein
MKKRAKKLTLAKETVRDLESLAKARGGTLSGSPAQTWQATCAGCGGDKSAWPNICQQEPISHDTQC